MKNTGGVKFLQNALYSLYMIRIQENDKILGLWLI